MNETHMSSLAADHVAGLRNEARLFRMARTDGSREVRVTERSFRLPRLLGFGSRLRKAGA